ncbi:DUF3817 domain-containing protein [Canibacter sp. lx-72]|uniref:DUF3817 domain-containing protein n=1 Tax=Canibacter zhuwentaonis TaxID=2837491 RepID=UPI001BDD3B8B|nr:DUF3817 domain-containing protein [Canibacter zhuwentaonis]MBT1018442.1 DUF3817 domain-containing protein [Canibacter zhuwentaonis]MBT1035631.1 DUF3817 domain-containing protein [Canibacter zhuwentaonis]
MSGSLKPRPETYPQLARSLKFFRVSSMITGVMLFGLYIISSIRWFMHSDIYLFNTSSFAQLVQLPPEGVSVDFEPSGVNFTTVFLIAHGWFYVLYLIAAFSIWSAMRWNFWKFLALAFAGCVIIVSFIAERWVVREARAVLNYGRDAPAADGMAA